MARLMSLHDASEFLWGVCTRSSVARTRRFLVAHGLPTFRDGRRIYVRASDLEARFGTEQ